MKTQQSFRVAAFILSSFWPSWSTSAFSQETPGHGASGPEQMVMAPADSDGDFTTRVQPLLPASTGLEALPSIPAPAAHDGRASVLAQAQQPAAQPAPSPQPGAPNMPAPAAGAQAAPGEFAVSEEDAQRALERALVQTGAALLPFGAVEFVPTMTYQFRSLSQPGQIALTSSGTVLVTEDVTRFTQFETNLLFRVGLPFDAQAEIKFPWEYKSQSLTVRATGSGLSEHGIEAQGYGDAGVSLTKQILVESDVLPGLFAGLVWDSNTGQVKSGLPLGTGFHELSAGLTAVKRQDPLVFTAGFAYQTSLEYNGVKPGDQFSPSVGVLLSVSPETSLRAAQQITFGEKDRFHGTDVPGTEKNVGLFTFGVLSVLGRGLVLNLTVGIGETPDAPNFVVQLGVPIRLN